MDFRKDFDACYKKHKNELEQKAARLKIKLIYQEMMKRKELLQKELKEIEKLEKEEKTRYMEQFMDILE